MSAQELTIVNDLLRAARTTPQAPGWPERRAAMEATLAAFPLAEGVLREPVDANGVAAEWQGRADATPHIVMLYLHGGGYCVGSVATHRPLTTAIAHDFAGRVLSVDYRLAPEHPCPAAIDDAIAAYRFLLDQGVAPSGIVIAGDSAGGGLTLATLIALRDAGIPAPAGGWMISPWADLTQTSATMTSKTEDVSITAERLDEFAEAYAPAGDAGDPRATPLNATLAGLPPLLIQVGTAERLLDDALGVARKGATENVHVTFSAWPGQPHVWHIFNAMLSEGREAIHEGVDWAHARLTS